MTKQSRKIFVQGFPIEFAGAPADASLVIASNSERHLSEGAPGFSGEETAGFAPGVYQYQLISPVGLIDEGVLELKANLALAPEGVPVMPAREILRAIDAQLAGRATAAQKQISIGDKRIQYIDIVDLLRLRQYYAAKAAEEEGRGPLNGQRRIRYTWSCR